MSKFSSPEWLQMFQILLHVSKTEYESVQYSVCGSKPILQKHQCLIACVHCCIDITCD